MKLNGNKILVTGATSGIGRALAEKFCELDNQVIAVGRNEARLQELAQFSNKIIPFQCDIASRPELGRLFSFVELGHRDLNILINNAGIQHNCYLLDGTYTVQNLEEEINTNLVAPIKLAMKLTPILACNPNAAIVNVSSGLGIVPKAKSAVYCATKGAIHIFSKSLRYQLENVKVFEIIPPLVDTEMTKGRGKGKITPERVADEFISAFRRNRFEVNIQKVKLLRILNRISPKIADRIMKTTTV